MLDTLLVATKASAGIIRIRSLHGNTLQLLCSIGLYSETTNIESLFDLPCAGCEKTAIGHGLYSAEISACESGTDCRYSGYPFQSI
ncbi:MAG: hypothetical protein OEV15_09390, partial [Gallionella sp.]|nr:hypothetical protein [Gallionella sp.]